jgi:hypothetical protein
MLFRFGLDEQYSPASGTVNGLSGARNALECEANYR